MNNCLNARLKLFIAHIIELFLILSNLMVDPVTSKHAHTTSRSYSLIVDDSKQYTATCLSDWYRLLREYSTNNTEDDECEENNGRETVIDTCSCCSMKMESLEQLRYCELCKVLCCQNCATNRLSGLEFVGTEGSIIACDECFKIPRNFQKTTNLLYRLFNPTDNFENFSASVDIEWGISADSTPSETFLRSLDDLIINEDTLEESLRVLVDNQETYRRNSRPSVKEFTESTYKHISKLEFLASAYLEKVGSSLIARLQVDPVWVKTILRVVCHAVRSVVPRTSQGDENSLESYVEIVQDSEGHQCESEYFNGVVYDLSPSDFICFQDKSQDIRVVLLEFPLLFNGDRPADNSSESSMSFFSFSENSMDDYLKLEAQFLENLVLSKPELVICTDEMSEFALNWFRKENISCITKFPKKKLSKLARVSNFKSIKLSDLKFVTDINNYVGSITESRIVCSENRTQIFLDNLKPSGAGTILIKGDSNASVALITRALLYISYNLSLEMSFLSQDFCTFPDDYCRTFSGIKSSGDSRKKLRRYLSTGSLDTIGNDELFNFSPFVESIDWQESLRLTGDSVSVEFDTEYKLESEYTGKNHDSNLAHIFPRYFKVAELLVDRNGTVVDSQFRSPTMVSIYGPGDYSLGYYLTQMCFANSIPPENAVCFHHGGGQVIVEIMQLPCSFESLSSPNSIFMWSSCCHEDCRRRNSPIVEIANRTYNISFARFLEMIFGNRKGVSRVSSCQHNVYHNKILFFGKGNMVACFMHKKVHRYNLISSQFVNYDAQLAAAFKRVCGQNLRAAGAILMQGFAEYVASARVSYSLCSNFREVLELEILIHQHMKEFDSLVLHMMEKDHSLLEISSLAKDLLKWKEACQLLLQSFTPKPYACLCDSSRESKSDGQSSRRRSVRVRCMRHRSKSESPSRGDESYPLQCSQYLFFRYRKQVSMEEEVKMKFSPCTYIGFYRFIRIFFLSPDSKQFVVKNSNQIFDLRISPVLDGYFNVPKSPGGITIPIYFDQPSSWISNSLCSYDYLSWIHAMPVDKIKSLGLSLKQLMNQLDLKNPEEANSKLFEFLCSQSIASFDYFCDDVGETKTTRFYVRHFFPGQFFALRHKFCGGEFPFAQSLSSCFNWKATGGKSKATFCKTLDDRYVLKSISEKEFLMFLEVALDYFSYLAESFMTKKHTCLIKVVGMFELTSRDSFGNSSDTQYVVVMPNLFYGRKMTHVFDLKGSSRGRFIADKEGSSVLQDANFIKYNRGFPLSMTSSSIAVLRESLQRDTAFLSKFEIMDYSLLVGIDEENYEVVVGIIDYFRQYTIDKVLETHVKSVATLFGKGLPTVIPPDMYGQRILNAMLFNFTSPPSRTVCASYRSSQ